MLQLRSILNVADNTGAKKAAAIGALGKNQRYAKIGDVLKVHIKEAAPDGSVKKRGCCQRCCGAHQEIHSSS
jgi:large subunit ribosomal protein L14